MSTSLHNQKSNLPTFYLMSYYQIDFLKQKKKLLENRKVSLEGTTAHQE